MNITNKKLSYFSLILLSVLFCNCQPKNVDKTLSDQTKETKDSSAMPVSAPETNAAEPSIAADKNGNIYVVFVEHDAGKSADVYLQKFNKNGQSENEKIRVNPEKGMAKAWFGDAPTIKIADDNAIFIGWTANVETAAKSAANILYLSVSRDGGKSFDAPVKINDDDAPASHGMHSLAIGKNGQVFLAWLDERNVKSENHEGTSHEMIEPNSEVFFAVSNDDGKTFSKNIKLSSEVCPCCKTNLAIDANGKIYASWRQVVGDNFRHIAVASSENNGESFSNYTIVSDDQWQINACPVSGAPMFIDKSNNLKVFWYTAGKAGKAGLYNAESNDGGKSFSPRELIYEGSVNGTVSVFEKKEEFGTVFEETGKIYQSDKTAKIEEKTDGEVPSAVFIDGAVYIAFVKNTDGKKGVWLEKF